MCIESICGFLKLSYEGVRLSTHSLDLWVGMSHLTSLSRLTCSRPETWENLTFNRMVLFPPRSALVKLIWLEKELGVPEDTF